MFSAAAFVLFFVGSTVLAFARHPFFGLGLYLAVFYIHPPSRWWAYMLPDFRWSLIAGTVALLAVLLYREKAPAGTRPWYSTVPGVAILVYLVWFWIQNLWALSPNLHYEFSVRLTKYAIAFFLVYRLASDPKRSTDVLLLHVAGCALLGLIAVFVGRGGGGRLDGVGGPGIDDANTLGMYLATAIAVGAVLLLTLKGWRRVLVFVALPILLNGLILANSRGAMLGLLAGGAMAYYLCPPKKKWIFYSLAAVGLLGAVSLVDVAFVDRMFTIKSAVQRSEEIDSSAESRLVLIEAQMKMAARYPHGTGLRGTAALSREYLDVRWLTGGHEGGARSSHNTFMSALVEQGILGAIVYIWLCAWGITVVGKLKTLQRQRVDAELTAPAVACCAAIAVIWTAGQFTDYLMAEVQFWMFALLAASLEQIRVAVIEPGPAVRVSSHAQGSMREGRAT
jgi:hypothetical protein